MSVVYTITLSTRRRGECDDGGPLLQLGYSSQVSDLIKLGDHLSEREDADLCRIGITGESLGASIVVVRSSTAVQSAAPYAGPLTSRTFTTRAPGKSRSEVWGQCGRKTFASLCFDF
uniref:Peptidase S9 prolyl oligopeptidase catalytic domain-containing protein n=1 Tax=Oryza rufipogon TaxID=4529 RepID=A0A0E0P4S3_ORYRU